MVSQGWDKRLPVYTVSQRVWRTQVYNNHTPNFSSQEAKNTTILQMYWQINAIYSDIPYVLEARLVGNQASRPTQASKYKGDFWPNRALNREADSGLKLETRVRLRSLDNIQEGSSKQGYAKIQEKKLVTVQNF
jgi:hypothetical protein